MREVGEAASIAFCTMGGMMVSSSSNSGNNMHMQHRMLGNEHSNSNSGNEKMSAMANNNMGGVAQDDMNGHTHDMHGMDHMDNHDHNNMNHDMSMTGSGTIMYMDGFHSALFHSTPESPPPCLNFLHPTWTLHTQSKFIFAMVCVTLMGMLVEACGVWRVKCLRKGRQFRKEERRKRLQIELQEEQHRQQQDNHLMNNSLISEITSETRTESFTRPTPSRNHNVCPAFLRRIWRCILPKCIRGICVSCFCRNSSEREVARTIRGWESAAAFLHALRALLGYALMLTVMSYAIEFLVCTVVGMVLGRFFFVDMEGTSGNNGVGVGVGGGIGGMGLGGGGGGDGGISLQGADLPPTHRSLHIPNNERDGTWGGGDPCCGIDDDDDDDNFEVNNIRAPLLTDFPGVLQNPGISRRSAVGGERL